MFCSALRCPLPVRVVSVGRFMVSAFLYIFPFSTFFSHSRFSILASSFTQQLCPKVTYTFLCSCLLSPPFPPLISSCHVVLSSHVDPSIEASSFQVDPPFKWPLPLMWTSPFKWPLPHKWLLLSYESSFLAPPSQPAPERAAGTSVKMGRRYCCYLNLYRRNQSSSPKSDTPIENL